MKDHVLEEISHKVTRTYYRQIFKRIWFSAIDAISITNSKGVIIDVNPAYLKMCGFKIDRIIGHKFSVIFPKELRKRADSEYRAIFFSKHDPASMMTTMQTADSSIRYIDINFSFLMKRGKRIALVSYIRDITDRKLIEKKKDELFHIAKHELKSPLTSIKGFLQLIERKHGVYSSQIRNYIRQIDRNADKLNILIDEMLDVSNILEPHSLKLSIFDFDQLLDDCIESMKLDSKHKITRIGKADLRIVADKTKIEQVFVNILSNAIKYSPKSDKIEVFTGRNHSSLVISIKDYGIGISKDQQSLIFNARFRGQNTSQIEGSGMGLYIAKQMIVEHGGTLSIQSERNKGSIFTFTIPIVTEDFVHLLS